MDVGRSQRQEENHRRLQNKKAPRGFWKPSVASWEREFCKVIGSMDWNVFLQKKKYIHLHPKAMEWNDIAGEEAFNNAKRRFWSQKNHSSYDVPLPDPDIYICNVDGDSEIDKELDFERISSEEDDEGPDFIGDPLVPESYQDIVPTGWGDVIDAPAVTFSARYGDLLGSD